MPASLNKYLQNSSPLQANSDIFLANPAKCVLLKSGGYICETISRLLSTSKYANIASSHALV